jgi:hypothetical protein
MGEWQPIETAPKDGTEFDGWGYSIPDSGHMPQDPESGRRTECFWGERDSHYVKPKEGWCATGHDGWSWGMVLTHWMPPPAPPTT